MATNSYNSPFKKPSKMTRFADYNQVYMYSKSKEVQADQSLLLNDNESQDLIETDHKTHYEISQSKQSVLAQEIDPQIADLQAQLEKMREQIIGEKNPPIPNQTNELQAMVLQQTEQVKNPNSIYVNENNQQFLNGRDTMNVEEAKGMKQNALSIDDREQSNNKKRKKVMLQKMKDAPTSINKKISEQMKKRQRITMDVNSLINLVQSYGKQEQMQISKIDKIRKSRVTLDINAITEMLNRDLQKDINEKRGQNDKNEIDRKILSKNKTPIKQANQDIKLVVNRYYDEVQNRIKNKQKQKEELLQNIEIIKKRMIQKQAQIQLQEIKMKQIQNQVIIIKQKINQLIEKCTKQRYINAVQKIRQIQYKYNLQIKKYFTDKKNNEFYGQFILNNIYLKIKKQKLKNIVDLRITNNIISQLQPIDNLFEITNLIKIIKNYFHHNLETLNNLNQILQKIIIFKQKLHNLQQDIQNIMLIIPLNDLEINSSMDRLNFKITLLPNFIFVFDIDLMKLNQHNYISIYNLYARNYFHLSNKNQIYSTPILNAFYDLIDNYV